MAALPEHFTRTLEGDTEIGIPRRVLTVSQRKLLTAIEHRTPLEEVHTVSKMDAARLRRDSRRLSDLGLIREVPQRREPSAASWAEVIDGGRPATRGTAAPQANKPVGRNRPARDRGPWMVGALGALLLLVGALGTWFLAPLPGLKPNAAAATSAAAPEDPRPSAASRPALPHPQTPRNTSGTANPAR